MRISSVVAVLAVMLVAAAPVAADVMTFNSGSTGSQSYTEGLMTVRSIYPQGSPPTGHLHFSGGRLQNHGLCCSEPYEFKLNSGNAFGLTSVVVSSGANVNSVFQAFDASNNLVATHSFGTLGLHTFGPAWQGISKVLWQQNAPPGSFSTYIDNLTYDPNPVPEPATMALLGVGGLGLLAEARRRRRKVNKA